MLVSLTLPLNFNLEHHREFSLEVISKAPRLLVGKYSVGEVLTDRVGKHNA